MAITQNPSGDVELTLHEGLSSEMDSSGFTSAVGEQASLSTTEPGLFGIPVTTTTPNYTAQSQAGIKENFKSSLDTAISSYIGTLKQKINQVETNANVSQGFNGTEIEASVKKLIVALKNEVTYYATALQNAQEEIVAAVESAYSKHDAEVAGEMDADTATLAHGGGDSGQTP